MSWDLETYPASPRALHPPKKLRTWSDHSQIGPTRPLSTWRFGVALPSSLLLAPSFQILRIIRTPYPNPPGGAKFPAWGGKNREGLPQPSKQRKYVSAFISQSILGIVVKLGVY